MHVYLAVWMVGALASFCLLAVGARELSGALSISQSLCIRSAIGLIFLTIVYLANYREINNQLIESSKKTKYSKKIKLHIFRNVFHYAAQYGWFFGIGLLPLAEVFALEFTVPIWTLIIAVLFLGEKVTWTKLSSITLGTLAVFIIVQPGSAIIDNASLVVLLAAIFFAASHTLTKSLSLTESPFSILFYMCAIQFPIGLALSFSSWLWPNTEQWLWLIVIGLSALSAHFCLAKSMQYADVTSIVTLDFFRLPLIALVGVFFYAEDFELSLLVGGIMMLVANLINLYKIKGNNNEEKLT